VARTAVNRAYHAPVDRTRGADLQQLHVVVPLRNLRDGKSRLEGALEPERREAVIAGMLRQTLDVLAAWPACRRVHVVSSDAAALALARAAGANALAEAEPAHLNRAIVTGIDAALASGATAVLCLPADLPLLTPAALQTVLDAADAATAAGGGRPLVVAAPADARGGTNALLLSPPDAIEPSFGEDSLAAHLAAAARADATVQLVIEPTLGFDLDTLADLARLETGQLEALVRLGRDAAATPSR